MAEQPSSSPLVWLVLAVLALGAGGIFLLRGQTPPAKADAPKSGSEAKPAAGTLRIAVIPKGTTHEFLEDHPCRRDQGRARADRRRDPGVDHLEGSAQGG